MNPQILIMLQQALQAFQNGNYERADSILVKIIKVDSKNLPAFHILGLIKASQNKYQEAAELLGRAVKLDPNEPSIRYNLARALVDSGAYLESLPHHKKTVELAPNNPEAWLNYGKVLSHLSRYDEALGCYEEALRIKPDYFEAVLDKGDALYSLRCFEEAITIYDKALTLKPDYCKLHSRRGAALHMLKRFEEAIASYDKAISFNPGDCLYLYNKGISLSALGRFEEAVSYYDQALLLKPDYCEASVYKGSALASMKQFEEAIVQCNHALSLQPNNADCWAIKAAALSELSQFEEAINHYEKALSLNQAIDWIYGDVIHRKMKVCSWTSIDASINDLAGRLLLNEKATNPFALISLSDDSKLQKKSSEIYNRAKYPFNGALGRLSKHLENEKIRIGYFSADFHNHATSYLMAELFELHDKDKFELFGFSFGPLKNDEMRQRLEKSFNKFIEVGDKTDIDIARLSRSLHIDIAVDLKGFTQDARTAIFSYRAAPIQVNYLGYPGTMGAEYIDYIIADKTLIPLESQSSYSEKVVYLPNSYQVNDRKRVIAEKIFSRKELGLPDTGFVFCSFNNSYKILPSMFNSWMRILKAVEGSVLWLFEDNNLASENLKNEAQKRGVDSSRLIFSKRMPLPDHLARHQQADLFLDTFPYNAHTTASDALWAGLPLLTLMGESFASRVAASLLHSMDLPELVTFSQDEYEALAIELANNPVILDGLKKKLINNRLTTPLFDTPSFTRSLESAYIEMYQREQKGLQISPITIS